MPPENLAANATHEAVLLTWAPDAVASGYLVFRRPLGQGEFVQINQSPVSGTSFTDKSAALQPGTIFEYRVDSDGWEEGGKGELPSIIEVTIGDAPVTDHSVPKEPDLNMLPIPKP